MNFLKYILLFLLLPAGVMAQTVKPIGQPNDLNSYRGGLSVDSFIHVPVRDTTAWHGRHSDFVRDGKALKYWDADSNRYRALGAADAGFIHYADTANTIATKYYAKSLIDGELTQVITGVTTNTLTLSKPVDATKHIEIIMNTAVIYPVDYTVSGDIVTLSFTPESTDKFLIYIKYKTP